ncbi:MAG: hypothetical protein KGV51_04095 [Moraxellaceae bacterium]|nr:hypothetical protein [Moraxellaceae bacterium]
MQLRPVNAIFYHPKYKFIVIYQQGTLWQLPRMKVDIDSWRRKLSYNGDNSDLYFYPHQQIEDEELAEIIPTYEFPASLNNCSLQTFENWWLANSHHWIKAQDASLPNHTSLTLELELDTNNDESLEPEPPYFASSEMATEKNEVVAPKNTEDFFDNLLKNWDNL